MIYSGKHKDYEICVFACDIDELFYSHMKPDWLTKVGAKGWLSHNAHRVYLRAFVFCDTVLERHKNGQMGFKDPVIIWANKEKGLFSVHPGQNRIILKMLLPEVRMVGWVVDNTVHSRTEYNGIFNNIKPIVRDKDGNRKLLWQMQHRSNVPGEDQYHQALATDTYLGDQQYDTESRKHKWEWLQHERGFSCYVGNKYYYDIGRPTAKYDFDNIAGIYQAFLHHFFDYPYEKWDKLYFKEL